MNQLTINAEEFGLEKSQAEQITSGLTQILTERKTLSEMYEEVIKLEITQENIQKFKELRLSIRDNRTKGIEAWHKVNKEFYLRGGQFVDAIKRKEVVENERMEANLKQNEDYFLNLEAERFEAEMKVRLDRVYKFNTEVTLHDVRQFNNDNFELFLSAVEKQYNDKIEAERIVEEQRIERERIEKRHSERQLIFAPYTDFMPPCFNMDDTDEVFNNLLNEAKELKRKHEKEAEAQRLENERLRKEAEQKEAELKDEREKAENERLRIEAENKAKLDAERLEREKVEAELKAKQEAELKAENERKALEEKARKEAEKAAKAPIKAQMKTWVLGLNAGTPPQLNETSKDIIDKFESFRSWALTQIDNL